MRSLTARSVFYKVFLLCIALVWVLNGLYCKLLNQVPRHELIVARILGPTYAPEMRKAIGMLEVCMSVWIMTGYRSRLNALIQVLVIVIMNTIEFIKAPDLLLYGHFNAVAASFFIVFIIVNEYLIRPPKPA